MKKRIVLMAVFLLTALLFTGCALRTVDEMYVLPKRSEGYSNLQSAIDQAMTGLTYSSPVAGENQQTVQMADLDGDGVDEYLIYASGSSAKPLQVLIFRQEADGTCSLMDVIESNGSAFEQVEYMDMDDVPGVELVVGRQVSDQVLRSVSVYTFSEGSARQLMMVGYTKFLTCDLDANGLGELMVILPADVNTGRNSAVLYSVRNSSIVRSMEAEIAGEASNIRRTMVSKLHGGIPAVYVSSIAEGSTILTDVFTLKDGTFSNITLDAEISTGIPTLRNYYVYADDLNEDGILELPRLMNMKPVSDQADYEEQFLIRWYTMTLGAEEADQLFTFHDFLGGWYLLLDQDWASRVSVEQDVSGYNFYAWDESYKIATSLFSIYAFTGSNRDELATADGCFPLYRSEGVVYAARLSYSAMLYNITEESLQTDFHLIQYDWRSGDV